jgi:hypothetical protein
MAAAWRNQWQSISEEKAGVISANGVAMQRENILAAKMWLASKAYGVSGPG